MKHFLDIKTLTKEEINKIVQVAINEKHAFKINRPQYSEALCGKVLAMIFQKPSTRTRLSFDLAMRQLGGSTIILNANEMQLGHGETISDTAKVLSRFVNAIMLRCYKEDDLLELAKHSNIPVVNALTNESHPCQILAAMMTFIEHNKNLLTAKLAWFGDFNNVTNSYIELAEKLDIHFVISSPGITSKQQTIIDEVKSEKIYYEQNPEIAIKDADIVITDTWVSMGDKINGVEITGVFKEDYEKHTAKYHPYQVNSTLTALAKKDFIFSHCLPTHRNEEVTDEIIDGKNSIVFDEAENRLHVQKAILLYMFGII